MLMEVNAARVIKAVTNTPLDIPEDAEVIDVCKAVEDMMNESKTEGAVAVLAGLVKDGVPITGYIESFIREHINQDTDIINVPQMMIDYFHTTPKVPDTNFLVVGYRLENDIPSQQIFWLNVKDESISPIDTTFPGARWDGETQTLSKIIQNTYMRDEDGKEISLGEMKVSWGLFTLQDAIDFAQYAVDVTIKTMHYSSVVETVGGPIDILVIKPERSFWIQHKELHA